jgi:polyadenylation factor subunit 2
VCGKFVPFVSAESEHKQKNPLFAVQWMKGGKYVLTGSSSGDIIIWNAQSFDRKANTAHQSRVQTLCWTNYEKFILSGDNQGLIVYSDSKMNLHYKLQAHNKLCVRDLSFSPVSLKFVSCSDDTTARIFDFLTAKEEFEYQGHGSDVKTCHYVRLWDPRSGKDTNTMQPHNKTINQVRWNPINGNWLLTGSHDGSLKVHDIRVMKEFNTF